MVVSALDVAGSADVHLLGSAHSNASIFTITPGAPPIKLVGITLEASILLPAFADEPRRLSDPHPNPRPHPQPSP